MSYNEFSVKTFSVPAKFGDIDSTEEREKYIRDLLLLPPRELKTKLHEQDLHNLFILASYLRNKLETIEIKETADLLRFNRLLTFVKRQFGERIKAENKVAIIKADAKHYLESVLAPHKTGFLTRLVNRIAKMITGEDYIQMYEYYQKYNMREMSKAILLKKFSSLSESDQAIFLSVLFVQSAQIIQKVIAAQSLDDLDRLRKHSIPTYQEKLAALSKMIDEYESTIRQSSPAVKAEQYLNANKHLLNEIAGTQDASYDNCKIDSGQNSYVLHLINPNDTKTVENVHERIILHYAIESLKEGNLGELKDTLFSKS